MWPQQIVNEGQKIIDSINFANTTPAKENVLKFLNVNPDKIKVVIIGQDPYPTKNIANGLAFAVNYGHKIPASLKNIFQEIKEIKGYVTTDCTLEHWQNQGVLLLNAALTTTINKPNAHHKIWYDYIQRVITFLDDYNAHIKWVLWGNFAQKIAQNIKGKKIIDAHPSPLSVKYRNKNTFRILSDIDW